MNYIPQFRVDEAAPLIITVMVRIIVLVRITTVLVTIIMFVKRINVLNGCWGQ